MPFYRPVEVCFWSECVRYQRLAYRTTAPLQPTPDLMPCGCPLLALQYMLLDYTKFKPGNALQEGALWVVEQIPGYVEGADVTDILSRSFWSSYNVPFFREVYDRLGYLQVDARSGRAPYSEYQLAPRAKIFRRESGSVEDVEGLKRVLRFNEYQTDPFSEGDPMNSICSRGDLGKDKHRFAGGCYDTKVTNYAMHKLMQSEAINGPTTHGGLPAFKWSEWNGTNSHQGLPDVYDFEFELMDPEWGPL